MYIFLKFIWNVWYFTGFYCPFLKLMHINIYIYIYIYIHTHTHTHTYVYWLFGTGIIGALNTPPSPRECNCASVAANSLRLPLRELPLTGGRPLTL